MCLFRGIWCFPFPDFVSISPRTALGTVGAGGVWSLLVPNVPMHALHMINEVIVSGESVARDGTVTTIVVTRVWLGSMTVKTMRFTLMS